MASQLQTETNGLSSQRRGTAYYFKSFLKWLGVGIVTVIVLSMAYQALATALDRRGYPPPGELLTVDGRQMHLYCTGEGDPTVILEAGAFSFSSEWYWVQRQLSETQRVCSYDRFGNGWSDPATGSRDSVTIANELHTLLAAAGIAEPYILVGHSLGGIIAPVYAHHYPEQAAGLVLVDSAVPIAFAHPENPDEAVVQYQADNESAYGLMMALARLGLVRVILENELVGYGYPNDAVTQLVAFKSTVAAVENWDAEVRRAQRELGVQMQAAADQGTLPLAVLWAENPELTASEDRARLQAIWDTFAVYSANSVTRVIDGANHGSIIGNPEYAAQVSEAVLEVIEAARTGEPLPAG